MAQSGAGTGEVGKESSVMGALEGEGGSKPKQQRGQAKMEQKPTGCIEDNAADLLRLGLTQLRT